jgi:hypothetical protein
MYVSSEIDPMAMFKNLRNSRTPCFADPSAMFAAAE